MRKSRFSEEQIIGILKEHQAGIGAKEFCRKLALWRNDYNTVRPHSSLGNKTPAEARRARSPQIAQASGALAQTETHEYQNQTRRLSL
ncbi:integrase core domain-containing protein [Pseudophaeobacter sp. 1A16562]|uniref:integrase core domain-containing protein n=1 Tax=Pseudophaeobacter sp. 1A16562 TaxID=3098143 RepID=UPI0034D7729D